MSTSMAGFISWENFQQKYLSREDGHRYEWLDGKIEKTKNGLGSAQLYILRNIWGHFDKIKSKGNAEGCLFSKPDLFFLKNHRRPDICWLTEQQIYALAEPESYEVPSFLIEVISNNDHINKVKLKLNNYLEAGVKVVWFIYPKLKQVEVFSGKKLEHSTTFEGGQVCSAAPALPAFEISVGDIFYLPEAV